MDQGLSRRSFVGLAAAGTAAIGAAGLAGYSSTATAIASVGIPDAWDYEADFVVVGAGTALTGALKAVVDGMSCIVVEARDTVGGTTAWSGGSVWIPCNGMAPDTREAAKAYMTAMADGHASEIKIDTYLDNCVDMMNFVADNAGIVWAVRDRTDYHVELEGGTEYTRTIMPVDQETGELWGTKAGELITQPEADAFEEKGGTIFTETKAQRLISRPIDDGMQEVLGIVAIDPYGRILNIKAKKAVLLGAGGFDYNEEMKSRYLTVPINGSAMVETHDGTGIRMGQGVGCDLAMMSYGWGMPSGQGGGGSGSWAWINHYGRRFCDEAANYDSLQFAFRDNRNTFGKMEYANMPAWYVCDHANRETSGRTFGVTADQDVPDTIAQADTLEELAAKLGFDEIATENFLLQMVRFNKYAVEGKDPEFHRGESLYDQGGAGRPTNVLGPISQPPFYANEIGPGFMGTKGGIAVNEIGQALHVTGKTVPRLYACGNNSGYGTPGLHYTGAGGTVAPGMIISYLAAIDVAKLEDWE